MAKGDRQTHHFPFGGPNTTDELWLVESFLLNRCGIAASKESIEKVRNLLREFAEQASAIAKDYGKDGAGDMDSADYGQAALMTALAFDLPAEDEGDGDGDE